MQKPTSILLGLCALSISLVAPVRAQAPADAANTNTSIALDGQTVMRIRTGAGGYTAEQRADAVRHRLIPILSLRNLRPGDVMVEMINPNQSNIMVRGELLLTVDQTLARANGESPEQLAQAWAANLRRTLPASAVGGGGQYHQGQL